MPPYRREPQVVWRPNVVVAAVVERDGRYLLVDEETEAGRRFNQPAGHLESGESLLDAVRRETLEETAWTFEPAGLLGVYRLWYPDATTTFLRFAFTGTVRDHQPTRALDQGIIATAWLTPAEVRDRIAEMRSPLVLRCIEDHLSGRCYPLELLADWVA